MNSKVPGGGAEGKARPSKVQAKAEPGTSCAFCCLVLTVYPTLKGMTPSDHDTFRDHLEKVHGLAGEIRP